MRVFAAILAVLIGVAGWHYSFYSHAAVRLEGIENPQVNRRRHRLRRINGVAMLLLATLFAVGIFTSDADAAPQRFFVVWLTVLTLLAVIIVLAVADLRYTAQLRRKR